MKKNCLLKTGFTLVEVIIYTAIFAMMISALGAFMQTMTQSRIRNQAMLEVNDQGAQVLRVITQNLRNATAVNTPAIGAIANSLSINTELSSTTPTTFVLSGGTIFMSQGSNPSVALTNNKVSASNLSFYNLSRSSTPGTVRVNFILSSLTNTTQAQYNYSSTFYGSGTLR